MQPVSPQSLTILGYFARVGRATQADARAAFPDMSRHRVKECADSLRRSGWIVSEGDCIATGKPVYAITRTGRNRWEESQRPAAATVERMNIMTRGNYVPTATQAARAAGMRAYELPSLHAGQPVPRARPLIMASRVTSGVPGR